MTLFLVDTELPGFKRGRNLDKIGMHAADTSELFFDNVPLAADAALVRAGNGFCHLMDELPRERLMLAVAAVAHAEWALVRTIELDRKITLLNSIPLFASLFPSSSF